jgi:alkylglycerol monooxygenase
MENKLYTDYLAIVTPIFLVFIGIELFFIWKQKKKDHYRFNDSVNNLTMGTLEQLTGFFLNIIFFTGYIWIYQNLKIFNIPTDAWWAWVLCFLAADFLYYLFHWSSHKISVAWGSHEPHHSSEEYNLSVALRQGAFQKCFSFYFFYVLALLGFDPIMYITCYQFNLIYQFWIHTRLIKKMWKPIEIVMNTPSHHRVHHGRDPKYIDKNFAGTFIIWDKLCGTFKEEEEEPTFGIVRPINTWNPAWGQIKNWYTLLESSFKMKGFINKIKVWVCVPGWQPDEMGGRMEIPEVDRSVYKKYDADISSNSMLIYLMANFLITALVFIMLSEPKIAIYLTNLDRIAIIAYTVSSLILIGSIFDCRPWTSWAEVLRISFFTLFMVYYSYSIVNSLILLATFMLVGIGFVGWFNYCKNKNVKAISVASS